LIFYEVFVIVIISTVILYVLAQVHSALGDKNSTSKWWSRGLKVLSIVFGVIGFVYLGIEVIQYFSIEDLRCDPDIKTLDSKLQNSIIQNSYRFGTLLTVSGVISFVATAGLSLRRKLNAFHRSKR